MGEYESYKYVIGQTYPMTETIHYPTLRTILLVEKTLRDHDGDVLSKARIERLLEGRVHRKTLNLVLDYLLASKKVVKSPEGFLWIFVEKGNYDQLYKNALRVA